MRRRWKALVAVGAVALAIAFVVITIATKSRCGRERSLVGTWHLERSDGRNLSEMRFDSDGTWEYLFSYKGRSTRSLGTYELQGDKITINVREDYASSGTVKRRDDVQQGHLEWLAQDRIRWHSNRVTSPPAIWVRE